MRWGGKVRGRERGREGVLRVSNDRGRESVM